MPSNIFDEREAMIAKAIAEFPATFGLRAFPGKTFTISKSASYVSDFPTPNTIYLYTFLDGRSFCKGTPEELRKQITAVPR